jgi:DNA-binding MurR/RpiR family transcriptional regulator
MPRDGDSRRAASGRADAAEPAQNQVPQLPPPSVAPSTGLAHLQASIQQRIADLGPKQRSIARYIVENHSTVVFSTANEVGSAAGASGATVVRFAQLLGYDGFLELRDSLRDQRPSFPTFLDQLSDLSRRPPTTDSELVNLVVNWEQENLRATLGLLDPHALAEVAKRIPAARKTVLVGTGVGGVVVKLLAGHLSRFGLPYVVPVDTVDEVIALSRVGPDDIVLGVSFWRFVRSTSQWLHEAKRRGATAAAIVDSPLYPTADDVDYLLVVSSRNTGHGPSVVAATAVVNALLSAIILTDFDRFYTSIQNVDKAYGESNIYLDW